MIPKKIHYCWFGGNQMPDLAIKCIESWKKYLPEYELVEWNENNFDLNLYKYAKEAYDSKKFAHVTDVCRLYVLKEYGGIYMDTDVEVLKPLDQFLVHSAFSGFESNSIVPTGIMASVAQGRWVNDMLSYYDNISFFDKDNNPILTPNTKIITEQMVEVGFVMNDTFQEKKDYIAFYPHDYFCPKSYITQKIELTANTHCIHHFAGSWLSPRLKLIIRLQRAVVNILGERNLTTLRKIKAKILS